MPVIDRVDDLDFGAGAPSYPEAERAVDPFEDPVVLTVSALLLAASFDAELLVDPDLGFLELLHIDVFDPFLHLLPDLDGW